MSIEIKQTTQFNLKELSIQTKSGKIDIRQIFDEINIFDSIFVPSISGKLVITDAVGMSQNLLFDGSEILFVNIGKDEENLNLKKAFRIFKQTDRKNLNETSERYTLHFFSDEFLYSEQQRVNQYYKASYSEIAISILLDYLKVPVTQLRGSFNSSYGVREVVIPNLKPFEAIDWCAKRAVDDRSSPNFLFFQNFLGFNFTTISHLLSQDYLFKVNFGVKNLGEKYQDLTTVRYAQVISQYDLINNTRMGVYSGKFIGFDPMTRVIDTKKISFFDHYQNMDHGNKNPNFSAIKNREDKLNTEMYDSRKSLFYFTEPLKYSNYVKSHDPSLLNTIEDTHNTIFQRKALLSQLTTQRVSIVIPGNFSVNSGFNLFLNFPSNAVKSQNGEPFDKSLYGKYIILATRHIIRPESHETVIELSTSSSEKDVPSADTVEQSRASLSYDG